MAQVKLDMSEYELMKDKARLLEESLAREKELGDQLAESRQKEIDALLANEKSVTIRKKVQVIETIQQKTSDEDIIRFLKQKMAKVITNCMNSILGDHSHKQFLSHSLIDREFAFSHEIESELNYYTRLIDLRPHEMHGLFFEKTRDKHLPEEETVTRRGLDEVAAEMKSEALSELMKNAREALSENPILKRDARDAKSESKSLKKKLKLAESLSESKTKELEETYKLLSDSEALNKDNEAKLAGISLEMSRKSSIFTHSKKLREIDRILTIKDEN